MWLLLFLKIFFALNILILSPVTELFKEHPRNVGYILRSVYLKFAGIHFNIISYICQEMNAKQKSQVLSKSNISQLWEVDNVKGGKVERNFFQYTSVGEDRCLTLIRLPSNAPSSQYIQHYISPTDTFETPHSPWISYNTFSIQNSTNHAQLFQNDSNKRVQPPWGFPSRSTRTSY